MSLPVGETGAETPGPGAPPPPARPLVPAPLQLQPLAPMPEPAAPGRVRRAHRARTLAGPTDPRRPLRAVVRPTDRRRRSAHARSCPRSTRGRGRGRGESPSPADRRAQRAVSIAPPGAPPDPGTIACPRCATTIGPDQAWCLACGAPPGHGWSRPPTGARRWRCWRSSRPRRHRARGRLRQPHQRHRARRAGQLPGAAAVGHEHAPAAGAATPTEPAPTTAAPQGRRPAATRRAGHRDRRGRHHLGSLGRVASASRWRRWAAKQHHRGKGVPAPVTGLRRRSAQLRVSQHLRQQPRGWAT